MKTMRAFMKVTVAGGFLFLVPLVLTVLLVREVLQFARKLFAPLARSSRPSTWPGSRSWTYYRVTCARQ